MINLDGSPGSTDTISGFVNATGSTVSTRSSASTGANVINGGPGNDDIDTRSGGTGDTVNGGGDADTIHDDSAGGDTLSGGGDPGDTLTYAGRLVPRRSISMGRRAARTRSPGSSTRRAAVVSTRSSARRQRHQRWSG